MARFIRYPNPSSQAESILRRSHRELSVENWPARFGWVEGEFPFISSDTGVTGSTITLNTGTLSGPGTKIITWAKDNEYLPEFDGLTSISPTLPGMYQAKIKVQDWAIDAWTNEVKITDANAWPADFNPSYVEYSELRDPTDGGAVGARVWVFGDFPLEDDFDLVRIATTSTTATTPNSLCLPNQTYQNSGSYAVGTTVYGRLMWKRKSDGEIRLALPPSGTTAGPATDADDRPYPRSLTTYPNDPTRGQIAITILGYEGSVTNTAPVFIGEPDLQGTGIVGQALSATQAPATGTPTPALTNVWYENGVENPAITGLNPTPSSGDVGKSITYRTRATNTVGSALSSSTSAITIIIAGSGTVNVSSVAEMVAAAQSTAGGKAIALSAGNYSETVNISNKNYTSKLILTSQDENNPATFTKQGFNIDNVRNMEISKFYFRDSRTDPNRIQSGSNVAATSALGARFSTIQDFLIEDLFFDRHHIGIDFRGVIDSTVQYITFERNGMDPMRSYSWGPIRNFTISRILSHNTLIYLPDMNEGTRHPDGLCQFAVNWNANLGTHQTPPDGVRVEYCYAETLQTGCALHGIFFGNSACRPPGPTPGSVNEGGDFSLAEAGYRNIELYNLYVNASHTHGIGIEGMNGLLVERCHLHRSPAAPTTQDKFTPQIHTLGSKYANVTIRDVTSQKVPGYGHNGLAGALTAIRYTESENAPANFSPLYKSGVNKNVGCRI